MRSDLALIVIKDLKQKAKAKLKNVDGVGYLADVY
jgi:hypothetical protein